MNRQRNKPPGDDTLLKVIDLRAEGYTWSFVARSVDRSESTVRKWSKRYASRWKRLFESSERVVVLDSTAEAVNKLRRHLRLDEKKDETDRDGRAARAFLSHRVRMRREDRLDQMFRLKRIEWGIRSGTPHRRDPFADYPPALRDELLRDWNDRQVTRTYSRAERLEKARECAASFIAFTLTDSGDRPLRRCRLHDDLHHFLDAHPKALIELPRDHGKTSQVCGRILWELGRNPGLRIKLVCATDALAVERSRFLRAQISGNPRVRMVFPKLIPAEPWAAEAFTVERPAESIWPSVAAFGVGAGSTGARADLLVCDDIVDVRSLHCPGERRRVRDYFHNNLMNLLEPDGRFWGLFTPWHRDDLNAHLKANAAYPLFRRPVGADGEPVWAEKWTRELLLERKAAIGEAGFARGYRLETRSEDEVLIRPEWVKFWGEPPDRGRYEAIVLAVDPAVSVKASADRSGLVVAGICSPLPSGRGVGGEGVSPATGLPEILPPHPGPLPSGRGREVHILHVEAHRLLTPDLTDRIAAVNALCRPDVILFESNAAFAGIKEMLSRDGRFGAKVVGHAATRNKDARIAALSVAVQNGCVRLKGQSGVVDAAQRELFDELTSYPFGTHDDLADATAAAVEYLLGQPDPRVW